MVVLFVWWMLTLVTRANKVCNGLNRHSCKGCIAQDSGDSYIYIFFCFQDEIERLRKMLMVKSRWRTVTHLLYQLYPAPSNRMRKLIGQSGSLPTLVQQQQKENWLEVLLELYTTAWLIGRINTYVYMYTNKVKRRRDIFIKSNRCPVEWIAVCPLSVKFNCKHQYVLFVDTIHTLSTIRSLQWTIKYICHYYYYYLIYDFYNLWYFLKIISVVHVLIIIFDWKFNACLL